MLIKLNVFNAIFSCLVTSMNKLYAALGSPALPGWTASGGDPCIEAWQGIVCDATNTNILSMYGNPSLAILQKFLCVDC